MAESSPYLHSTPAVAQPAFGEQTLRRIQRLANRAIAAMSLDLRDMAILTEAATGPFAVTPVLASMAGAKSVVAVTRDSRWGPADEAIRQVRALAEQCGVADAIRFTTDSPHSVASGCDIVTNLGFVRPLDARLIASLSDTAAISLMWEPWEFRPGEIDLDALRAQKVALIATNEGHPEVRTFEYLGPTVARLLLEAGIELVGTRLAVLGSNPFGGAIAEWLGRAGAHVTRDWPLSGNERPLDALIVAEHRQHDFRIDDRALPALRQLAQQGGALIRLCGEIEDAVITETGVNLYPNLPAPNGVMTVTTAYAGPRPVIDLHAAGLKAAQIVVQARRAGATIDEAIRASVADGYGLRLISEGAI